MNNKKVNSTIKAVILSVISIFLIIVLAVGVGTHRLGKFVKNEIVDSVFNKEETTSAADQTGANQTGDYSTTIPAFQEDGKSSTISAQGITKLDIEWASGTVIVDSTSDGNDIKILQDSNSTESYISNQNGELTIKCCASNLTHSKSCNKIIKILVPSTVALNEIDVSAASATAQIKANAQKIDVETMSGAITVEADAKTVDLKSTSGSIHFNGIASAKTELNTVSGEIDFYSSQIPPQLDFETVSGEINANVQKNEPVKIQMKTVSGNFNCNSEVLDVQIDKNNYYATSKNTNAQTVYKTIEIETISGNFNYIAS